MHIQQASELNVQELFDELFNKCRSITGPEYEESLKILSRYIPFEIESYPCGSKVCDWTVPEEWSLKRATLKDSKGNIILDTNDNLLHVLNFSEPFKGKVTFDELKAHLYYDSKNPEAIPYTTSYYKARWGLNISYNQFLELKDDVYEVDIQTTKNKNGSLKIAMCELKGESDKIVQISSYLCHPNMLNNELSGPLALVCLYHLIKAMPKRRYTYRFVINPETIGSISYLSRHFAELKKNLIYGIHLSCVAAPRSKGSADDAIKTIALPLCDVESQNFEDKYAAHEELHRAFMECYEQNFIKLPVSFKLTRQSYIDSIKYDKSLRVSGQNITSYPRDSYLDKSLKLDSCVSYEVTDLSIDDDERVQSYLATEAKYHRTYAYKYKSMCHIFSSPHDSEFQCTFDVDNKLRSLAYADKDRYAIRTYATNHGSDEKQYCSPKLNMAFVQASRTMYGAYGTYHSSLDNQDTFSLSSVIDSALDIYDFVRYYEISSLKPVVRFECDPQLGPRGLYPDSNDPETRRRYFDQSDAVSVMLNTLALCSCDFTVDEIADYIGQSPIRVANILYKLRDKDVLDLVQ